MKNLYESAKEIYKLNDQLSIINDMRYKQGISILTEADLKVTDGSVKKSTEPDKKYDEFTSIVMEMTVYNKTAVASVFRSRSNYGEFKIVSRVWYKQSDGSLKAVSCRSFDQRKTDVITLDQLVTENNQKPISQLKKFGEFYLISNFNINKFKNYVEDDIDLKSLQNIHNEIEQKEGIIHEHLERLLKDLPKTKGSGQYGW